MINRIEVELIWTVTQPGFDFTTTASYVQRLPFYYTDALSRKEALSEAIQVVQMNKNSATLIILIDWRGLKGVQLSF